MMMMMIDHSLDPEKTINGSTRPSWKLYENPFYNSHPSSISSTYINNNLHLRYCLKHLASSSSSSSTNSFLDLAYFRHLMESEIEFARTQIMELKSELEYERKARKKVESFAKRLAKELDEERKGRETMEKLCRELATEISSDKQQIDRMKKEIEEERKMLRLAEVLREERVQMKLAEVRILFEDKILELEDQMKNQKKSEEDDHNEGAERNSIVNFSAKLKQFSAGSELSVGGVLQRRVSAAAATAAVSATPETENPHIMRGIKGFVEFPRLIRGRGYKNLDSDAKLECQKAQLRVLLKQKWPIRSNNLIIS